MRIRATRILVRRLLAVTAGAVALLLASTHTEAHKPITSPYTYNDDVFPIVRDRCGRCHRSGGVAPMSLMTYKEAFPWGESIRTELVAGHMPPWSVETAAGRFKNAQPLGARELNVLLTWATGGNPVGDPERALPSIAPPPTWRLGEPDLVLPMSAEFTIGADDMERREEFILPLPPTAMTLVQAVDLAPGNPAIVRSASVSVRVPSDTGDRGSATAVAASGTSGRLLPERVLAMWVPGDEPVPLDGGTAFALPRGSNLVLRVQYKKTWEYERKTLSDRTSVGLYFAKGAAKEVHALTLAPEGAAASAQPLSFTRTVDEDLQALAIYPDQSLANVNIEVTAQQPNGAREQLIRFRPQPDWARRYWFSTPVALPRGTRISVAATMDEALLPPGAAPLLPKRPDASALRLTLNVVKP